MQRFLIQDPCHPFSQGDIDNFATIPHKFSLLLFLKHDLPLFQAGNLELASLLKPQFDKIVRDNNSIFMHRFVFNLYMIENLIED